MILQRPISHRGSIYVVTLTHYYCHKLFLFSCFNIDHQQVHLFGHFLFNQLVKVPMTLIFFFLYFCLIAVLRLY